jgi:hypothetical protein
MTKPTTIPAKTVSECADACGTRLTGKYRDDGLMDRLDFLLLQNVTRKECRNEQHDQDEECP